jgi:hypothetical protein
MAASTSLEASGTRVVEAYWMASWLQSYDFFKSSLSVFNRLPTEGYTQGGKFWVRRCRDQELEGVRNTELRQVRAARFVTPYVLYGGLYCLLCRMT